MWPLRWLLVFLFISCLDGLGNDQERHPELNAAQLGTVHFPVACTSSEQTPFEHGLALLHSFWYAEAEKQFLEISSDDPQCAMAHWGVAMSLWHQLWDEPDATIIRRGLAESQKAAQINSDQQPPRSSLPASYPNDALAHERAYISAISRFYSGSEKLDYTARASAYSAAMKEVYESYPDDHEAAAFYALSLLASDNDLANRKQAAAILEKLFALEPDHPGVAHYLIHSYDTPQMAELGIPAAHRYAEIAPAAPHALHMPSHIFARVGLWQDDINSNPASIAATRKAVGMGMGGNEEHQFHAMDFLVYGYLQSGQEAEAQKIIDEVKAMPPSRDTHGMKFNPRIYSEANFEASYALELRQWGNAASLSPVAGAPSEYSAVTFLARANGAARAGQLTDARKDIDEVQSIVKMLLDQGRKGEADFLDGQTAEPLAWIAHAEGKDDDAIRVLRPLADRETEGMSTTGSLPAQEVLADLLLEAKRPQQALNEYQSDLKINPNRFNGLAGAAASAEQAGNHQKAVEYYALLLKVCEGSHSLRPEIIRAKELVVQR
jgi:tetratricopeptide (TPR) repeat protein